MKSIFPELTERKLTRHDEIAPGVFVIGFERRHVFIPGQAVKLGIDAENPPRIYSICSGPADGEICILFNVKEGGFLTPKLAGMKPGDSVFASAPYGTFLGTEDPAWWIAAGTGIAPFRSMIRARRTAGKTLVHGVRHVNQFYFETEFREALGDHYFRCCSAEKTPGVFPGRVTAFLENQPDLPAENKYFICGQAAMAVETRDVLISRGIPFTNIITEIYF